MNPIAAGTFTVSTHTTRTVVVKSARTGNTLVWTTVEHLTLAASGLGVDNHRQSENRQSVSEMSLKIVLTKHIKNLDICRYVKPKVCCTHVDGFSKTQKSDKNGIEKL